MAKTNPTKKRLVVSGIIATIFIAIGASLYIIWSQRQSESEKVQRTTEFSIVLPKGKTVNDVGELELVSPPQADPVYAYTDKISSVTIIVSQQKIPASFKDDVAGSVEELAKKDNANRELDAGNIAAFIGKSSKGPQSVYFTKDDLLIFIKSQKEISDADWVQYIASLRK